MTRTALLSVFALVACSDGTGTLSVDGDAPAFGTVASAAWLVIDAGPEDIGNPSYLTLTNVPRYCEKVDAYVDAAWAYREAAGAASEETWCTEMKAPAAAVARAAAQVWPEGANVATFALFRTDGGALEDTYAVGVEPVGFTGGFEYGQVNRYASWLTDWDETCGIEPAAGVDAASFWDVTAGELDITDYEEGASIAGSLDVTIASEAGEAVVEGTFDGGWCEASYAH